MKREHHNIGACTVHPADVLLSVAFCKSVTSIRNSVLQKKNPSSSARALRTHARLGSYSTTAIIATDMPAAMSPYWIAVAAGTSRMNRRMDFFMGASCS